MELSRLILIVRHRLVLLVLIVIAGSGASYLGTSRGSMYEAHATIYIGRASSAVTPSVAASQAVLALSLAPLIPTPAVVASAVSNAHVTRAVDEVAKNTTAMVAPGTNLIQVFVKDSDPVVAKILVNAITQNFVAGTQVLASATSDPPPASVAQTAVVPTSPLHTGLARNVELGGLAGLLIGLAIILAVDGVGLSARTPRQLEESTGMRVLGIVPFSPKIAEASVAAALLVGDDA
ncbi:MAG: hypothetical protein M3063_05120 [Actinomycetota bacterium]|nr:hypothetical protein [Actinomycetota bacterium]